MPFDVFAEGPCVQSSRGDSTPMGKSVIVHAWAANENDFNVAMMRLDGGLVLHEITEVEWGELQRR